MNDFFKKFQDIEQKDVKLEEAITKEVEISSDEKEVKDLIQKIINGQCFSTIIYNFQEHKEFLGFVKVMDRLGYSLNRFRMNDDYKRYFTKTNWTSEYIIVKNIQDTYANRISKFLSPGFWTTDSAMLFFTLLSNKSGKITPEETSALENLVRDLNENNRFTASIRTLPPWFIDKINSYSKKNNLGFPSAMYSTARPDVCNYSSIEQADAAARIKAANLQEILLTDKDQDIINFPDSGHLYEFVIASCGNFSGAERLRDNLMHYHFFQNYPEDFKMPSYLVSANLGIGKKTTESKFKIESNGIIASAIVNRAYKIEKERGPLIF